MSNIDPGPSRPAKDPNRDSAKESARNPVSRADLFRCLSDLGIQTETHEHPAVFTVAESDELVPELPGAHTKNLFLKDAKGRLFLVIARTDTQVHLKSLHKILGCARLSFGKPDLLMDILGVSPGSVTAFSVINDTDKRVTVVLDQTLMGDDMINCHPLENTATTTIRRADLLRFIKACGFEPVVVSLEPAGTG